MEKIKSVFNRYFEPAIYWAGFIVGMLALSLNTSCGNPTGGQNPSAMSQRDSLELIVLKEQARIIEVRAERARKDSIFNAKLDSIRDARVDEVPDGRTTFEFD